MDETPKPATIGDLRSLGLKGFHIICAAQTCRHQANMTFDALGMPDETAFPSIPTLRRFTCKACRGRAVWVFPDWRDHQAYGAMMK